MVVVKCVDNEGAPELKVGKAYVVVDLSYDGLCKLDDNDKLYCRGRFETMGDSIPAGWEGEVVI